MGETRVDLLHLLEDLRDAYPGSVEETILTEIVANSLDSQAAEIVVRTDPVASTLTVSDDGSGMSRQALSRYHDLAYTSKRRGQSIGFAGVGIKLGLLISDEVVTETRRARTHLATSWRLSSKSRAPWRWIEPPGLQEVPGTTLRMYLSNPLSELLEPGFVETVLLRHFQPLFDSDFDQLLSATYPMGVRFTVNGRPLRRFDGDPDRVPVLLKIGRQRKASAVGFLLRSGVLPEDERGIAISTLGKVIKRGWDWLGLTPEDADRISGVLEVPALVEALTLNKADFVRAGPRGAKYMAYRKALQEAIAGQLGAWGDAPRPSDRRPRKVRALERDLQSVLAGLSDDYPILATLVERRPGGQHKLPFGAPAPVGAKAVAMGGALQLEDANARHDGSVDGSSEPTVSEPRDAPRQITAAVTPSGKRGPKKPARLGLSVRFDSRPEDSALGVLIETTLWVNDAHSAFKRAAASRSEGYHIAITMAMTLAPLAVEAHDTHTFINAFLSAWGQAGGTGR